MNRLDVVHIKLPQVIQLHTSMITEYSTIQYCTALFCCHYVCLYLSVMLSQNLFPNFISLWIGLAVQHHNDTLQIKIYFRSLDFPQNQTFLKIFLVHKTTSLRYFGAACTCIRNVYVLLNMQYFQNACFFRYLCSDYCIYKFIKQLKSNLYDVLYFVKNFLSSIN